jgi:hypothetical protein
MKNLLAGMKAGLVTTYGKWATLALTNMLGISIVWTYLLILNWKVAIVASLLGSIPVSTYMLFNFSIMMNESFDRISKGLPTMTGKMALPLVAHYVCCWVAVLGGLAWVKVF